MSRRTEIKRVLMILAALVSAPQGANAENDVRGVVRSLREAVLTTDLSARLIKFPLKDGDSFSEGDLLAEFDCDRHRAELRAAEAENNGHKLQLENNLHLLRHKAIGSYDVALSRTQAEKSAATAQSIRVRINQCRLLAPYAGRVVEAIAHEYEMPATNAPLMKIVDHRNLETDFIVPSRWLRHLKPEMAIDLTVEETGGKYRGKLKRIGAQVDAVSQTLKITIGFDGVADGVMPGMSVSAVFERQEM